MHMGSGRAKQGLPSGGRRSCAAPLLTVGAVCNQFFRSVSRARPRDSHLRWLPGADQLEVARALPGAVRGSDDTAYGLERLNQALVDPALCTRIDPPGEQFLSPRFGSSLSAIHTDFMLTNSRMPCIPNSRP